MSRGWSGDNAMRGDAGRPRHPRGHPRARLPGGQRPPADWRSSDGYHSGRPKDLGDPGYEFDPPWNGRTPGRGTEWDSGGWRGDGPPRPPGTGGYPRAPGTDGFDAVRDTGGFPVSPEYDGYRVAHGMSGNFARGPAGIPGEGTAPGMPWGARGGALPGDSGGFPAAWDPDGFDGGQDYGFYQGMRDPGGSREYWGAAAPPPGPPAGLRYTPTISTGSPIAPADPPAEFGQPPPGRAGRLPGTGPLAGRPAAGGVISGWVVTGPMRSAGPPRVSGGFPVPGGTGGPARSFDGQGGEDSRLRRLRAAAFQPAAESPAAGFRREVLRAMGSRNLVTGLAIPILAAIAVGMALVVAVGANNGRGGTVPSQLSAGYPPARIATADFTGNRVGVSAIAASGATQVAVGSAAGRPALWFSRDGGSTWARGAGTTPAALSRAGSQQVAAVADGPAGWVAVGGAAAPGTAAPRAGHPLVIGSADGGRRWSAEDDAAGFTGGNLVTASVAASKAGGYAIVGWQASGGHVTAKAWYSAGLSGWRQALVPAGGDSRLAAVTALSGGGFAAAGSSGSHPAAWVSRDGKAWRQVTLALPGSAVRAALEHVAANGSTVAATGTAVAASGARFPFAVISVDGGSSWDYGGLPSPGTTGPVTATAITAAGSGFTAAGTFGVPGSQDVVIWAHGPGDGGAWMAATPAGSGLSGPGAQEITALSSAGSTLTGAGFTAPGKAALPTLWQSPIRG